MDKILAVLTKEERYADRFCDYVNKKSSLILTAVPFHDVEACSAFSRKHPVEILLADHDLVGTDSGYGHEFMKSADIQAGRTIRLLDGYSFDRALADGKPSRYASINKYQPADVILRELMERCDDMELLKTSEAVGRPVRVLGVYSPVSRCGKTSFALTLCRILGKSQKTLYLSLEEFSGMGILSGEEYSACLSDAIYHMKQGSLSAQKIYSMVYNYCGVEYIPPIRYEDDRKAISGEDYVQLIGLILKNTNYETIVIDMNRFADEASEILEFCSTVYMPVLESYNDRLKIEEFMNHLHMSQRDQLISRIVQVSLPKPETVLTGPAYLDSLLYGSIGDLIRALGKD